MIRIVTDSAADLPQEILNELGITVVPLCVRFGDKVYRDRVDISEDEFYQRLARDPIHPNTTQPTPDEFARVYQSLAGDCSGIVSIHISGKLSGTVNSAIQGKDSAGGKCPVEVVDSLTLTVGQGLVVMEAARAAREGKALAEVAQAARQAVPDVHMLALFDTLKYVLMGGRLGKAKLLLGSILNVKPLLTLKEGEVMPAGQARTRSKGIQRLVEFAGSAIDVQDMAVAYNTTPDEAQALAERIGPAKTGRKPILARIGPVLGAHLGPGALIVALRGKMAP